MKKNQSIFTVIGASNHSLSDREEHDYYATSPRAVHFLCELETFNKNILEPACGEGHIAEVLKEKGCQVKSTDLIDRGYADEVIDFFQIKQFNGDIVTNPPYKYAQEFVEHALQIVPEGSKVAMYLKLTFLESRTREKLFTEHPPKVVYVTRQRLGCAKNGDFGTYGDKGAIAYAWYVWEKGFKGDPIIKWFN